MIDRNDMEVISDKIRIIVNQLIDKKYKEYFDAEVRHAVRAEIDRMLLQMRENIK